MTPPNDARPARDVVNRRDEGLPRREQWPREVEEVQEVGPARRRRDLLGGDPPGPAFGGQRNLPDGDTPSADRLGALTRRQEREPKLWEVRANVVESARQRSCIARDAGMAGGDQADKPDGEGLAQGLDRR
jgi:hypothetical protein